jgi:hypothetical protein
MLCVAYDCRVFIYFFPLFSSVDPGIDVATKDCYTDDPSVAAELLGKQTPLDHFNIAYSFPLVLALELLLYCCLLF